MTGFVVLPRWVVERTFCWFGRNRRLAKDYENLAETLGEVRNVSLLAQRQHDEAKCRVTREATPQVFRAGDPVNV